jgi:hypothetical protein
METLTKKPNVLPGAVTLYATPIYNVTNIIDDLIYINDSSLLYKFECAIDSLKIELSDARSDAGLLNNCNITAFIPGWSSFNDKILTKIKQFRFLVIYQETDGEFRFLGSRHSGLYFSATFNSDPKGHNIAFTGSISSQILPSDNSVSCKSVLIQL